MNSYIKKFACFATTGAIVTLGALAGAQERGGLTVSGTTVDEKGKVMHGILVKAKKGPMTVTVLSKFDGRFTIPGLQPGTYEVRAVRRGLVADPQQVTIPDAKPVSFMLKPGPVNRFNLSTRDLQHVLPDSPYKQTLLECEVCHSWSGLAARTQNYTVENWIAGIVFRLALFT